MKCFISYIKEGLILVICSLLAGCASTPDNPTLVNQFPRIYPDYKDVTIPVDICPLNFNYTGGEYQTVDVVVKGSKAGEIHANGDYAKFDIDEWHRLTEQNKGGILTVTVCVERDGEWSQYKDFTIHVSPYALDEWGLTYRRIAPGYEVYSHMGIFQRNLGNFEESVILDNRQVPGMCINCHVSNKTNPDQFTFHVRGNHGATLVQQNGKREWLNTKTDSTLGSCVYPYWHGSGKYIAYSTNTTRQGFHAIPNERIEVFDYGSDVQVYDPSTHELLLSPLLQTKDWSENEPVFSPDGKTLYFTTAKSQSYPSHFKDEKYNLCKISFNPATGRFGNKVDTVFNASAMGKSLTWPKPSYDGKYIMFTLCDYGYFSIWHNESDQWLLDLNTGKARPMVEVNSNKADSYHNWNVNSHWFVFTSRRGDGLYSNLYLASIDEKGRISKPFLLPQENPGEYYSESLYSFNTPDFTSKKVEFDNRAAGNEISGDKRIDIKVR